MKKIIIAAITAAIFISCSKTESSNAVDTPLQISSTINTRAVGTVWEKGDEIGVSMFESGSLLGIGAANTLYTTQSTTQSADFTTSSPLYYPQSGKVDILAYYPYIADGDGVSYKLDMTESQTDLMAAKCADLSKSNSSIPLSFYHLLSKVNITLKAGEDMTESELKNRVTLKLSGLKTTATYNLAAFDSENSTSLEPFESLDDVADISLSLDELTASCIVIPQSVTLPKLSIYVEGYGSSYLTFSATEYKAGYNTDYIVTVNYLEVISLTLSGATISDWSNGTGGSGTAN